MCTANPGAARRVARNRAYNARIDTAAAALETASRAAEHACRLNALYDALPDGSIDIDVSGQLGRFIAGLRRGGWKEGEVGGA